MLRPILALSAIAVIGLPGRAQLRPVDVPIQRVQLRFENGAWVRTSANALESAGTTGVIFNNTCPFPPSFTVCNGNVVLDDGRLPSPTSPAPNTGAFTVYRVTQLEFGYCTFDRDVANGGPGTTVQVDFWEDYDDCNNLGSAGSPTATRTFNGLPGSPVQGIQTCWIVTMDLTGLEFELKADADGTYQGAPSLDGFGYGLSMPSQGGPSWGAILCAGSGCSQGSGTYYNNPGGGAATGLANDPAHYVDGSTICAVPTCLTSPGASGFYMKMWGDLDDCNGNQIPDGTDIASGTPDCNANGVPDDCEAMIYGYCTAGTSGAGCQALLSTSGLASATVPSGFLVNAQNVEGSKTGIFFFGPNGRQANPWGNGTSYQCVVPPVRRTPLQGSGGTFGSCDGSMSVDFNQHWNVFKPPHNPGASAIVQTQLWYRDPTNSSNQTTSLSNAIEFIVCP